VSSSAFSKTLERVGKTFTVVPEPSGEGDAFEGLGGGASLPSDSSFTGGGE
jgi:hypothetical protein